jgi:hypothetical protein
MENKKQTAAEWLLAHLLHFLEFSDSKEREHFRKCLSDAKAMERQYIKEAYIMGWITRENKPIKTEAKHSDYADIYLEHYYEQ